ncbi:MAG: tetratricopeptide repeat protein [Thermoanaerobacteraceae bacterium]|nr:tetratricopeptide repeat protein [Thermoanaerobacteraceae bacterium]
MIWKKKNIEDDLNLAQALFESLQLSIEFSIDPIHKKAKQIVEKAKDRHEVLDKIIELCQNIEHPKAYYLIGTAYVWKGAKFRREAIYYLEKYLDNPVEIKKSYYSREGKLIDGFTSGVQISFIYGDLGKCYEGEYEFEKALEYYQKAAELDPSVPSVYVHIAQVYAKMKNLDEAIKVLQEAKNSKYYTPIKTISPIDGSTHYDNTFKITIDNYLEDLKEKKEKGYIYKPRIKKGE